MSVEAENHLEAFIAANSGGRELKKIELSGLTFNEFSNYLSVYGNQFKARTAFLDNVFVTIRDITMQVLTKYDDDNDRFIFEYSSMRLGHLENLTYVSAEGSGIGMSYDVLYTGGEFLDADSRAFMALGSRISCDIYVLE